MIVVDSCGWLEWFSDGPNSDAFHDVLDAPSTLIVPSITIFEVHRVATRLSGQEFADAYVWRMCRSLVVDLDDQISLLASDLSSTHGLATADAIIYATASFHGAELHTRDAHFKGLPEVRYFPKSVEA